MIIFEKISEIPLDLGSGAVLKKPALFPRARRARGPKIKISRGRGGRGGQKFKFTAGAGGRGGQKLKISAGAAGAGVIN